ncbi:MAG: Hsp70 family protein, partial [Egibacteraceae bacterium]
MGGVPYSAEALAAKLLRWVVGKVSEGQGGPPQRLVITQPASWGPYKQEAFAQAVRMAELGDVVMLTEPEAAAISYAAAERVDVGSTVAVYDLGGGTFDAVVLRKTRAGFDLLGAPEGIERLGGVDFDETVFTHVQRALDARALEQLDPHDPTALAAMARLRQECVDAKEALSSDTDVSIPVLLPHLRTQVRLVRSEFEAMIRPAVGDTIAALRRAMRSAQVEPEDLSAVLLVGGSSRIPLVAQMVSAELGRPLALDAHPKHATALGAALAAGGHQALRIGIGEPPLPPVAQGVVTQAPVTQGVDTRPPPRPPLVASSVSHFLGGAAPARTRRGTPLQAPPEAPPGAPPFPHRDTTRGHLPTARGRHRDPLTVLLVAAALAASAVLPFLWMSTGWRPDPPAPTTSPATPTADPSAPAAVAPVPEPAPARVTPVQPARREAAARPRASIPPPTNPPTNLPPTPTPTPTPAPTPTPTPTP